MHHDPIVFVIFIIFAGAAILATVALYARLSLLLVYIVLGGLMGPSGLKLVPDPELVQNLSQIGVIFLLFLLGATLKPQKLISLLRVSLVVTLATSFIFLTVGMGIALLFGFGLLQSLLVGACMMFSSTIIGLKLLPTTVLHHRHMGELIISILLIQDLIAVLILLLLQADWEQVVPVLEILNLLGRLLGLMLFALLFARYVLMRFIARFDRIHEYIFLMAIGWCLGMAQLATAIGLSPEIGAFIGGIALATHPISMFIAESLRPLRDFFLVIFFFALGARFDLAIVQGIWLQALVLAAVFLILKPLCFRWLIQRTGEPGDWSSEVGVPSWSDQ